MIFLIVLKIHLHAMRVCKNNAIEMSRSAPIRQGYDNPVRITQDSRLNHVERDIIMRVDDALNRRLQL